MSKAKPQTPKTFLTSVVAVRRRLLRTAKSMKWTSGMQMTMMMAEDLLLKNASDQRIIDFLRFHATGLRELIPARTATDSRLQYLKQITG
jgi:hypothetical protein